jgi:fructokinase
MRLGLDFGGTKIAGVVLDADGTEVASGRVPTPRHDYDGCIRAIRSLTDRLEQEAHGRIEQVGIGVPGSVDPVTGAVSLGNSVWLNNRDLRGDLHAALNRPVKVANDANCFALSEAVDGAGAGARVVFGIILGSGVGGGLVVDGKVLGGANAVCGEWGHMPLPSPMDDERPGPLCSCGVAGHCEAWLSGRSMAEDHARRTARDAREAMTAQEVVALAEAGDHAALETLRRYEDRLARALALIVNVVDPDVIVFGGGMSNVQRLYPNVPPLMKPHIFGSRFNTRLVANMHGDSSGVRGAAWL